jgi:polyhydroxyalkanoate synthase
MRLWQARFPRPQPRPADDADRHGRIACTANGSVADNPPFPSRAYREWITSMYKEHRLVRGTLRLHGTRVNLANIEQNLLAVTAGADHITPRANTVPLLDLVSSRDVTHFDRPGGHIGPIAGSKAKREIWPDLAAWLAERSGP